MENIIAELYYGNINPSSKTFERNSMYSESSKTFERNSMYSETMKIITDIEEKLLKQLDDKSLNLLKSFTNAQLNLNSITGVESFTDGFRLGTRLILEALDKSEHQNLKNFIK